MEISVYFRTYNSCGGHPTLSLIGDYLVYDSPPFGDAILNIELTMHFRSVGPPRKTLESIYDTFHAGLEELPRVVFRRKKCKAEVAFYSDLLTAREVEKSRQLSLDVFCNGCQEVVTHLMLLRKRIRRDDIFDFASFQSWLDQRVKDLPSTIEELRTIESEIISRQKITHDSLSEWEKTGIDFDEFHREARTVLDDPQLWDGCNEWSPNGNDTGADILEMYRKWRKRNRKTKAEKFFNQLMRDWEVNLPPAPNNEYGNYTYRQAIVGLAFAQLKLEAKCEPSIAALALRAVEQAPENDFTNMVQSVLQRYA